MSKISAKIRLRSTRFLSTEPTHVSFFHTDSSGGAVGLLCLHKALEGGESDIVSSHAVWNDLQQNRPDIAKTLASNIWAFNRKGEMSKGQKRMGYQTYLLFAKGTGCKQVVPFLRSLLSQVDRYRHVETGLFPPLSEEQKEAMKVLEETAQKLSLHMVLGVGDIQFVADTHVLHARTAYKDYPAPTPRRHLYRLWVAVPLQDGGWNNIYPDNTHLRRGGIQVDAQPPIYLLDGE